MQTRKPGLRALTLAMAGVLTLGLAACEETKTVTPLQPSVLTISPTGNVDLFVGDRIQIVSNLQNAGANATVTFASSNTAVATVDQSGTVTAVAPGIATITASATGNANETLRAAMTVRVTQRTPTPTTPTPPATDTAQANVVIQSVIDVGDGDEAITGLQGVIEVVVDVTPGNADSLHVMVGNVVACRQIFNPTASTTQLPAGISAAAAQAVFRCPVNTAALNADNTPTFPQGETTIVARLFNDGQIVSSAQQPVTVANANRASATIVADTTVIGPDGLRWNSGDVTVNVNPAVFTAGTTISRVTVQAVAVNEDGTTRVVASRTDLDASNGFSVTFPSCGSPSTGTLCAGGRVTTDQLQFRVASTTAAGTEGPQGTVGTIRYDNVAPVVAQFSLPNSVEDNFVGANFAFQSSASTAATAQRTSTARGVVDPGAATGEGVGGVDVDFFFAANTAANRRLLGDREFSDLQALAAVSTQVDSAQDIPASQGNDDSFIIVARATDALGNVNFVALEEAIFVDLEAPTLDIDTDVDTIYNISEAGQLPTTIAVEFEDDFAGFGDEPFSVVAQRITGLGTTCFIGDEAENEDADADQICEASRVETDELVIPATSAYYTYRIQIRDRAGNVSATDSILVLVDLDRPTVGNITTPLQLTPGGDARITAQALDNLDLDFGNIFLRYERGTGPGSLRFVPFTGQSEDLGSFGLPLTRTATIDLTTNNFVTSLYITAGDGTPEATPFLVSHTFSQVFDVARNFGGSDFVDVAGRVQGDRSVPLDASISAFDLAEATVCRGTDCGGEDRQITLTVTVSGADFPTGGPFEEVIFYSQVGVERFVIGTDRSATITSGGQLRYTARLDPRQIPVQDLDALGGITVFAVGVQDNGAAVQNAAFVNFVGSSE